MSKIPRSLHDLLAEALPAGQKYHVHHLSTCPESCKPIFAAAANQQPELTTQESHFLSVSIEHDSKLVHVLGMEVFVYTCNRLCTLFVSKADSTGCLTISESSHEPQNLRKSKQPPSPLKIITSVFIKFLIASLQQPNRPLLLSLFARAQNQYLFPASVCNPQKHVLDDCGLIRWWCQVVQMSLSTESAQAYLRVPGCEDHAIRSFFPPSPNEMVRWTTSDPLVTLPASDKLPLRCLIPRFPDDPKTRFLDSLDEELMDVSLLREGQDKIESEEESPKVLHDNWRSVKNLDQFWDAMSYRQECSAGRRVGFLWVVFESGLKVEDHNASKVGKCNGKEACDRDSELSQLHKDNGGTKAVISELVQREGEIIVSQETYNQIGEYLLSLDYTNASLAKDSTSNWIQYVINKADRPSWGRMVLGTKVYQFSPDTNKTDAPKSSPNILSSSLVRKKKRPLETIHQNLETMTPSINHESSDLLLNAHEGHDTKKIRANG